MTGTGIPTAEDFDLIKKLDKDIKKAALTLGAAEARYLVDAYYTIQEDRKRTTSQAKQLDGKEPNIVIEWFAEQNARLEKQLQVALDVYSYNHPIGSWARSVKGIGPVLAAGLLAHFDIHKAPTVGHFWAFAGLDPTKKWEKGCKRPWNADLKVLCWKIGESFCKLSGPKSANPSPYGLLYRERKAMEEGKNLAGDYADQASAALASKNYSKETEAYKHYIDGKLPPAQIDRRAKRWTVKVFLSHLHQVWFEHEFKRPAPVPYALAHLKHEHFIEVGTCKKVIK